VLDDISFRILAGSFCAIAGPSGVGKSTIADLILRFQDPDSGTVRLDGRDLRDLQLPGLRTAIALVDQSLFLMHAHQSTDLKWAPQTEQKLKIAAHSGEFFSQQTY
jgi:ATP-binding cassette, subfamily B, bacterial